MVEVLCKTQMLRARMGPSPCHPPHGLGASEFRTDLFSERHGGLCAGARDGDGGGLLGEGDGLVEVGLEGLVGAGEIADAAGGEVALALAVAVVGEAEMGVREVEKADGTL